MKRYTVFVIIVVSAVISSCVKSLYPLSENENEFIFKKELLGHWIDKDSTHYIVDTMNGKSGKIYKIAVIESKNKPATRNFSDTSHFFAFLISVQGRLFIDCSADMDRFANKNLGQSAVDAILPTHYFLRLTSISPDTLGLAFIDEGKLLDLLKQKKFTIRHEMIDEDNILLYEKSRGLQQKMIELGNPFHLWRWDPDSCGITAL